MADHETRTIPERRTRSTDHTPHPKPERKTDGPHTPTKHSKGHNTHLHKVHQMKPNYRIKKEDAIFTENLFQTGLQLKTLRQKGTLLHEAQEV